MTTPALEKPGVPICWCCGQAFEEARMARLGNHPEVRVCVRCARSLYRWALLSDEHESTRPSARIRRSAWRIRRWVVRRGLHRGAVLGRFLRWLGRRLP